MNGGPEGEEPQGPDGGVIDIRDRLAGSVGEKGSVAFSVWGGGGVRSRFALPVWRAIYVAEGDWGGVLCSDRRGNDGSIEPLFVLDLKEDPARIQPPSGCLPAFETESPPGLAYSPEGGVTVFLGKEGSRAWFLQIRGEKTKGLPGGKARETLLFLAGECAGLLFLRELSTPSPSSSSTP